MPIDPGAVGLKGKSVRRSWTSKDALLYALGVGAGVDELAFATENTKDTPQRVLPTMGVVLGGGGVPFDKIGTSTIQSRVTAGLAGTTFIFCLPGSPGACKDGWDGMLAQQLDYRHMPCNFVEIMPRLDEHLKRQKS